MNIEESLSSRLKTEVALVDGRVFPVKAPQGTAAPYIAYLKVSNKRYYTHSGFNGVSKARIQVSCFGKTYASSKSVADQVKEALESWARIGKVQTVFIENELDLFNEEVKTYHIPIDFLITYDE